MRQIYTYPNGSEIIIGGLDKPGKVMSTEYDLAYVQEAIEITEDAWESLTTRLRNNKLSYQQLLADTNPDRPTHWLKQRCDAGKTTKLESHHHDNPLLWDIEKQDWTPFGNTYIETLDNLTGPRKLRLRHGKWVQAEGLVYDGWDRSIHVVDKFSPPKEWRRWLSIDFGYIHPFVAQLWAEDKDGRLYLFREIYKTKVLVEDHARAIKNYLLWDQPRPYQVICDHDAEDRATLEKYLGLPTTKATKDVSPGIQAVASRLKVQPDGKPRLMVMRDSIVQRDPLLIEAKKPIGFADEIDGYIWSLKGGRQKGEEPVKEMDDSMDAARYMVAAVDVNPKKDFWML